MSDMAMLPEPTPDEKTMATLAQVLQIVGSWLAPLIIYLVRREVEVCLVPRHAGASGVDVSRIRRSLAGDHERFALQSVSGNFLRHQGGPWRMGGISRHR
jgi:hypothetical protein